MRRYAAPSYQLDRAINVFVLNNTYILNPTTVATFRFGMNTFDDDNSLPFDFDSHTLGWNPAYADAMTVQKFPSLTLSGAGGYAGTGFSGVNDRNYYSWGVNGSLTKLAGSHSFKMGADYRILGVDALNHGQSAGSFTFSGTFTGSNANNPNALEPQLHCRPAAGLSVIGNDHVQQPLRQLREVLRHVRPGRLARHRQADRSTTACGSNTKPGCARSTINWSWASIARR